MTVTLEMILNPKCFQQNSSKSKMISNCVSFSRKPMDVPGIELPFWETWHPSITIICEEVIPLFKMVINTHLFIMAGKILRPKKSKQIILLRCHYLDKDKVKWWWFHMLKIYFYAIVECVIITVNTNIILIFEIFLTHYILCRS